MVAEPLSMNVKSFGNIEQIPKLTRIDEDNIVKLVKGKMTRLMEKLPDIERLDSKDTDSHLQIISTDLLHVVRLIRTIKKHVHARIWEKCNDTPNMRCFYEFLEYLQKAVHRLFLVFISSFL